MNIQKEVRKEYEYYRRMQRMQDKEAQFRKKICHLTSKSFYHWNKFVCPRNIKKISLLILFCTSDTFCTSS